ncbi:MAG: DUF2490 domain-containing protein [Bacteroidota bacterium]
MRRLLVLLCIAGSTAYAQDRSEIWLGAGIKREVLKDLIAGVQTNARIRTDGKLETLFQEVSIKSEHLKWFRPSVDYRFITSYADNGNPTYSNRFNLNADFRKKIKEVKIGFRARYQLVIGSGGSSGSDLDPALRLKPYVEYLIPNTRFTPGFSAEFFYNPVFGEFGQRFNRMRFGLGTDIDMPGPNTLSFTYYYGRKYNTGNPYSEHLISLEYGFEWKKKKPAVAE